jgi:hypothetical protein
MYPVEQQGQLTLFPPGTRDHASLTVHPASAEARKMTALSGQRLLGSWMKSSPIGLLARMLVGTSHWGSTKCLMTWEGSATPRNRFIFQLSPLTQTMRGTESLSWPTPTASQDFKRIRPLAPSEKNGTHGKMLVGVVGDQYHELIGTWLDPRFQEALMGFPTGWSEVEP